MIPELSLRRKVLIIASDQRRRRGASSHGEGLPLSPSQRAYTHKRLNKALSPYLHGGRALPSEVLSIIRDRRYVKGVLLKLLEILAMFHVGGWT